MDKHLDAGGGNQWDIMPGGIEKHWPVFWPSGGGNNP